MNEHLETLHSLRLTGRQIKMLLAACCCIFIIRYLDKLLLPSLWAEDGPVFFGQVYDLGLKSLVVPYNGYILVSTRLTSYVCLLFPKIYVPYLFVVSSLVWNLLPLTLLFSKRSAHLFSSDIQKLGFAFILVCMPLPNLIGANITNYMWISHIWLILYLLSEKSTNVLIQLLELLICFLLAMTGPFVLFELLAIALIALGRLFKFRIADLILLIAAACIQLYFITQDQSHHAAIFSNGGLHWIQGIGIRMGLYSIVALLGFKISTLLVYYLKYYLIFIAIPAIGLWIYFAVLSLRQKSVLLVFIFVFSICIGLSSFIRAGGVINIDTSGRYFIASNVFIYMSILYFYQKRVWISYLAIISLCIAFPSNFIDMAPHKNDVKTILKYYYTAHKDDSVQVPGYQLEVDFKFKKKTDARSLSMLDYKILKFNTTFGYSELPSPNFKSIKDTILKCNILQNQIDNPCLHLEIDVSEKSSLWTDYFLVLESSKNRYIFDGIIYKNRLKDTCIFLESMRSLNPGQYDIWIYAVDKDLNAVRTKIISGFSNVGI